MSEHNLPEGYAYQAPGVQKSAKRRHVGRWLLLGLVLVAVIVGIAVANTPNPHSTPVPKLPGVVNAPAFPNLAPSDPPTTTAYTPVAADFELKVTVLSKECFGSAGCDLTYRVTPTYTGIGFSADKSVTVTYSVSGSSDGQTSQSFDMAGDGTATVDQEDDMSTASSGVVPKAAVTSVLANY
jgi:hypothetical protein